jgi:hypothetical protein
MTISKYTADAIGKKAQEPGHPASFRAMKTASIA